jgi:hypothetical protein
MNTPRLPIFFWKLIFSGPTFAMVCGLVLVGHYFLEDKVKLKSDLIEISSSLKDFSFSEYKGIKNHLFSYYLYLNSYKNNFQLVADFVNYFDKNKFEKTVMIGDTLKIEISRKKFSKINQNTKIEIFGIYKNNITYLDCEDTIHQYNSRSDFEFYFGIIVTLIGMIALINKSSKLNNIK